MIPNPNPMNVSLQRPPLLIAQVVPPQDTNSGDYYYRTHTPGIAMAREKGVFVINLTNEHRRKWKIAAQADVLVLKNICDPDFLPLIKRRKEQGKVTVYEIADDLAAIEPWNPGYFFYQDKENQSLVWRLAQYSDALQVSCSSLKDIYGHLNPVCRVFQNQISYVPPDNRISRRRNGLVIGWGGSHGHLQDMAEIAEPLTEWIMSESDVSLYLMASEPICRLFQRLPAEKKRLFPTGSIESYYDFLRHIHVGIGPLKNTASNQSRSDVKFLEYAVSGVVPVMKRLAPYVESIVHGETGFLYANPEDLVENLARLSRDPILLERVGKAARAYVIGNRLEAGHARERVQFYEDLLLKANGAKISSCSGEWITSWANLDGAMITGRHISLGPTKFELLLREGLSMQIANDREKAFRLFRRASAIEPENYLPYLYGAQVSPNPAETLMTAVRLNPSSLKARIMLGEDFAQRGNTLEALRWFKDASEIFPDLEIPCTTAALLPEESGRSGLEGLLSEKVTSFIRGEPRSGFPDAVPAIGLHS